MMKKQTEATNAQIWLFSTGNIANNLIFMTVTMFMMFYFTNIMGIDTVTAGTIFMVARLVDAFTDPLMGLIIDRTNFRHFGKYRGFIHFGAPLLGVVFVALFTMPQFDLSGRVVYAYLVYILYSLCWTVVQVPQLTIPIIMSNDVSTRVKVQSIFQALGSMAVSFITMGIYKLLDVFGGEGGMMSADAWQKSVIVIAIIATILFEISTLAVRNLDTYVPNKPKSQQASPDAPKLPLKERISFLTKNVALFMLLISFGTDMFASQLTSQTNTFFFLYNMNGNTDLQSILSTFTLPAAIILMFLAKPLAAKYGKKLVIVGCEIVCIVSNLMLLLLGASVPVVIIYSLISAIPMSLCNMLCRTALLDVASYTKWKTGVDAAGLFSSTFTFMNKLCQAFASYATGWLLHMIAFDSTQTVQSDGTVQGILVMRTIVPIIAYVITIIAMRFYPIDKKTEDELQVVLTQMNEQTQIAE